MRAQIFLLVAFAAFPLLAIMAYQAWRDMGGRVAEALSDLERSAAHTSAEVDNDIREAAILLRLLTLVPEVSGDGDTCRRTIEPVIAGHPRYSSLIVIHRDGTPRCATMVLVAGANFADREYFRRAMAQDGPVLSAPVISRTTGRAILPVALASRDRNGQATAVLVAALDAGAYFQFAARAHSYPELAMTWVDLAAQVVQRQPDPEKWSGQSLSGTSLAEVFGRIHGNGSAIARGLDGVERAHGVASIRELGGGGLKVGLSVPLASLTAQPWADLAWNAGIATLGTLLAFGLALWVGEVMIRKRLAALAAVAGRISRGDLAARVGGRYWADEIGMLTKHFDEMAAAVQAQQDHLRLSEERVRLHFEQTAMAAIEWDRDFRVLKWNPAAERIFGHSETQALGRHASFIVPRTAQAAVDEVWQALLSRSGGTHSVNENLREDGRLILCEWQNTPLIGADGAVVAVASLALDVTERERAEQEIRRLNAELECRVLERTHQLAEANKELESFAYSVSHDLRAPLRHVQGYADLLVAATKDQLSPKARRYLQVITEVSVEMGRLIDDLLSFSRMGRAEMHPARVDLDALVRECIGSLEMAVRGRSIDWRIASLPPVSGDAAMIRQVLANLLDNAVKYTRPRGEACIEVGCAGKEGGRLVSFVRDNGVGFDMQYVDKLFNVFQRLHRADEFEGTGIGLANVRRIVGRHGGRVWAESRMNEGAAFYFTLAPAPAAEPALEEKERP